MLVDVSDIAQSKPEAIPLRKRGTDLRALFSSAMEVFEQQAREIDIDLRVEAAGELPKNALVDPDKIAWAVTTLVGNAFRYARRGTRRMPGGSIVVEIRLDPKPNVLVIRVEDDGPGIPPEKVPKLFHRESEALHAPGLGLMLIHDVVVAHGGTIDVTSSIDAFNHGTAVTIQLPFVAA